MRASSTNVEEREGAHLVKVAVEIVNRRLPIEAKIDNLPALHDECAVEKGECVGRRAMDSSANCDAALHQTSDDRHDLQAL